MALGMVTIGTVRPAGVADLAPALTPWLPPQLAVPITAMTVATSHDRLKGFIVSPSTPVLDFYAKSNLKLAPENRDTARRGVRIPCLGIYVATSDRLETLTRQGFVSTSKTGGTPSAFPCWLSLVLLPVVGSWMCGWAGTGSQSGFVKGGGVFT
jgi:hypothetical protein